MTFHYDGPAQLLARTGQVLATVDVELSSGRAGSGLGSWGGRFSAHDLTGDVLEATRIRLPNGETANVIVTGVGDYGPGSASGRLEGSGPPPEPGVKTTPWF